VFAEAARHVTRDAEGVHITLVGSDGLRDRVRDLAGREAACCSFFTFVIEGQENDLSLDISIPEEHRASLDALADRAEALSA
jgi:hypothetical protein